MPRTEAGREMLRCLTETDRPPHGPASAEAHIDAIEAEAEHLGYLRANDCDHSECIEKIEELSEQIARQAAADGSLAEAFDAVRAVAAERERIRAAVEALPYLTIKNSPDRALNRAAVLDIIDAEASND